MDRFGLGRIRQDWIRLERIGQCGQIGWSGWIGQLGYIEQIGDKLDRLGQARLDQIRSNRQISTQINRRIDKQRNRIELGSRHHAEHDFTQTQMESAKHENSQCLCQLWPLQLGFTQQKETCYEIYTATTKINLARIYPIEIGMTHAPKIKIPDMYYKMFHLDSNCMY